MESGWRFFVFLALPSPVFVDSCAKRMGAMRITRDTCAVIAGIFNHILITHVWSYMWCLKSEFALQRFFFGKNVPWHVILFVVFSCYFFLKVCEEVRLSRIFLRGGLFDVGVDESQQKEDEKSLFPFFLWCFVRIDKPVLCVVGMFVCVRGVCVVGSVYCVCVCVFV